MRSRADKVAYCAVFTALGLILSYVEALIPINLLIPIPGFKLGLANLAVMIAFFSLGYGYAAAVSLCRILLTALLFGSVTSFWFSLTGGILALAAILLYKLILCRFCGAIGMSVMMAAMHNIGQCLVCSILFGYYVLTFYLPMLLFISLVTGSLTGIVIHRLLKIKFLIKDGSI
jgi:heptaprenyl diphosphate synthase